MTDSRDHAMWRTVLWTALAVAGLYVISRRNYLLFHSLAELFSIVVAMGVFELNASRSCVVV